MAGKLEIMMGPMRSNKTAELLRRAEMRRQYAGQYVLVLKPSDDTKGGPGMVESRNPNGHGKMKALEFNSQHPVLNNLAVQREIVGAAAKTNVGLLLDAYHLARSGAPGASFTDVPPEDIFCFQFSDLSPNPVTGVARPTDRLAPGKGTVRWREVLGLLAAKGFDGYLSYEAPNPELWARSPYDVAREGVELTRALLRDAVPQTAA